MRIFQKLTAFICALALLLCLVPITAFAAEEALLSEEGGRANARSEGVSSAEYQWELTATLLWQIADADRLPLKQGELLSEAKLRGFETTDLHTVVALPQYFRYTINTGTTKFNTAIEYDTDQNHYSYSRVKHYINQGKAYSYTYDTAGNISKIQSPDGSYVTYTYDSLNQLIKETYSTCLPLSGEVASANAEDGGVVSYDTIEYSYDERGNILSKTYLLNDETVETIHYGYTDTTWQDRLTSYNGVNITADEIGNPLTWHDGSAMSWQHGRQLASLTKDGVTSTYTYDDTGLRTSKTVGGVTTNYYVVDGTLRRLTSGTNTLQFIYGNGLSSVIFNGVEYWYVFNAQGDIIGLINASGSYVVQYTYDSWGKPLSKTGTLADTLGTLNPFRYRGYIYDEETGFYYCQTRYYDPQIGRFINSDNEALVTVTPESASWDKNLYAYCDNNPIVRVDHGGQFWDTIFDVVSLVSSVVEVCKNPDDPMAWAGLVGDVVDVAVPGLSGVGEVTRGLKVSSNLVETLDTAGDINRISKKAPVVIGENMKRVNQYAKEIGGHAYRPWKNDVFDYNTTMRRNKRWINDMMNEGREIIDIGPDFARRRTGITPSDFYNMERTQLKGYSNYRKVFTRQGRYGGLWGEW